ncbi:hypothetical protein DFH07DRAFT_957414 [Mycena maculata]|uniref:Uncharacterized protein n=1 Tax=Mycena maculata TaxID=230809 RepID=A0AAD7JCP3_9AGAR|nr:hypothetical protein DFH07DRAFT_957414 [Mycena maculata]
MSTPGAAAAAASTFVPAPPAGQAPPPPPNPLKRKYDEVISALGEAPVKKSSRGRRAPLETKSQLDKLLSMARFFPRGVNPFLDLGLAMTLGSTTRWGAASSLPSGNPVATSTNAAAPISDLDTKYIEAFNSMLAISPDSAEILRELYKNDDQWARILAKFRDAAAGARQGDTNGLKHKLKYLPSDSTMPIVPAIQDSESKSDRGINHPMLRDAIIPWSLRLVINAPAPTETETEEDAEEPEAVRALNALLFTGKLLNGKPALTAGRFPSCFYGDGQYDPLAPEVGLLRSLFLLRVLRHIWTTPSSAMDGATKLKQISNARAHGQLIITPPMIAYGCCQARTMLSTSEWKRKDGKYNYERLFDAVVELFKNPAGAWTIETLAWYQKGVFGACGTTGADNSDSEDEDSEISVIAARSSASSDS